MQSEEGKPLPHFFLYKQIIPIMTNKINSTTNKISDEFIHPSPLLFPIYATCAQYGTHSQSDNLYKQMGNFSLSIGKDVEIWYIKFCTYCLYYRIKLPSARFYPQPR